MKSVAGSGATSGALTVREKVKTPTLENQMSLFDAEAPDMEEGDCKERRDAQHRPRLHYGMKGRRGCPTRLCPRLDSIKAVKAVTSPRDAREPFPHRATTQKP